MGHLKETKISNHESERKKRLFLTTFHGWKSKVCYRVPQTMLQWNQLVTLVTAKKMPISKHTSRKKPKFSNS